MAPPTQISDLPGSILHTITACLPLRDIMTVSTLSKEWYSRWYSLSDLVFDSDIKSTFSYDTSRIIYRALLHHQGPVKKFVLKVAGKMSLTDVDHWIIHLSKHQLHHFDLNIRDGPRYRMRPRFFTFNYLRYLKLGRCVLQPPPQFNGFRTLVELHFWNCPFVGETFERFISKCSVLERVVLIGCTGLDSIEVVGPSLKIFNYHGFVNSIHFKSCPKLADVQLCSPLLQFGKVMCGNCDCVGNLLFLPFEDRQSYPRLLEFSSAENRFPCLSVLDLSMSLSSTREVDDAVSLIRRSPNLETIVIRLYQTDWVGEVIDYMQGQEKPNQDLNRLKRIELICYSGTVHQKAFAGYLLECAAELVEMVIVSASYNADFTSLPHQMRTEYRWASPNARLTVRGPDQKYSLLLHS